MHLQTLLCKRELLNLIMSNKIRHEGVIEAIGKAHVQVRIVQSSACAACKLAAHCNASETKEKHVDVYDVNSSHYRVGQAVTLSTTSHIGLMASLYAYGVPLVLMVATIIIVAMLTANEVMAAGIGLLVLLPYYLLLYLLRGKIGRQVYFEIENKQ